MDEQHRVSPHVLRRVVDAKNEEVAVANVDGIDALVVPVSGEAAETVGEMPAFKGMETLPVTVEEIEGVCKTHNLGVVGFYGFEGGGGLDVVSVETVGMILEEG